MARRLPRQPQVLRHFAVTGPRLDANNYVTLEYKLDPPQRVLDGGRQRVRSLDVRERAVADDGDDHLAEFGCICTTPRLPAVRWCRR